VKLVLREVDIMNLYSVMQWEAMRFPALVVLIENLPRGIGFIYN